MDHLKEVKRIYDEMCINPTIRRFNKHFSIDLLNDLNYFDVMKKFSWGVFFRSIYFICEQNKEETDLLFLTKLEFIGLSIRLLDDFLDEDGKINRILEAKQIILLSNELLIDGLSGISQRINCDLNLLKYALNCEWNDHSYDLRCKHIDCDFYFNKIVPKSTAIFRFFIKIASANSEEWDDFALSYGAFTQIKNDINGIFEEKELLNLRPSLPLIMAINTYDSNFNLSLLNDLKLRDKSLIDSIRIKILASGSIEFCKLLISEEQEKIFHYLCNLVPENMLEWFVTYLDLR